MAKTRKLFTKRRLKWAGLVVFVATLIVTCGSIWYWAHVYAHNANYIFSAPITHGLLRVRLDILGGDISLEPHFSSNFTRDPVPGFRWWFYGLFDSLRNPTDINVRIPLWLPLLLIAAPTAWLWRTDRRAKPWQCAKCRYDLRGLDGRNNGVCPECGTRLERET